jgi:hypothetical protein
MKLKRPWRLAILAVALLVLALGAAWAVMAFVPPGERTAPSIIALVIIAAAIVTLDYLVIKPSILHYAKQRAREVAAGRPGNAKEHRDISSVLARAHKDSEARELLQKLQKPGEEKPPEKSSRPHEES